ERIDAPLIARALVRGLADPVHDRVAQVDVRRGHVDLRAQRPGSVGELPRPHAAEQVEILVDRAVAERRRAAGLGQRAAVLADLLTREIVDVSFASLNELLGPLEAEPADVTRDGVDVLLALLGGVGVVEAQVAATTELAGHAEVDRDRLGVADVQVAVGLGRKPRDHLAPEAAGAVVLEDDVANEVAGFRLVGHPLDGITPIGVVSLSTWFSRAPEEASCPSP